VEVIQRLHKAYLAGIEIQRKKKEIYEINSRCNKAKMTVEGNKEQST